VHVQLVRVDAACKQLADCGADVTPGRVANDDRDAETLERKAGDDASDVIAEVSDAHLSVSSHRRGRDRDAALDQYKCIVYSRMDG